MSRLIFHRRLALLTLPLLLATFCACCCSSARAEEARAGWQVFSTSYPTNLAPGGSGFVEVQPFNVGAAASEGEVTVTDVLPAGVTATDVGTPGDKWDELFTGNDLEHKLWDCAITAGAAEDSVVTCHNDPAELPAITGGGGVTPGVGDSDAQPSILIAVHATANAAEGEQDNSMSVSGGGALEAVQASDPLLISAEPAPFGLERWGGWFSKRDGQQDDEAGSVPYAFTTSFALNTRLPAGETELANSGGESRDFIVKLPAGFVGDPQAVPTCTRENFDRKTCSPETVVGMIFAYTAPGIDTHLLIYNLVPPRGLPAQFGFVIEGIAGFIDPSVRSGSDYGITAEVPNTPQRVIIGATVTLWGIPHDLSHAPWTCTDSGYCAAGKPELGSHPTLAPFLRMPTSCGAVDPVSASINGWLAESEAFTPPLSFSTHGAGSEPVALTGCSQLPFAPSISSSTTTGLADSPSGLEFDLHVPQPEGVTPVEAEVEGETQDVGAEPELHESDLKDATITFPQGLAVNPSEADGLEACSEEQIGFTGLAELDPESERGVKTPQFTPEPAGCPNASKLGTVTVDTPLLGHPLEGSLYLARQGENPFGSLLAVYIAVDDPVSGVVIKLPGEVRLNATTGQVSTVVDQDPQLPFEDFRISLFGGTRAAFTTPATCGTFTTTSLLAPWSGTAAASPAGSFEVTGQPGGGACPATVASQPNAPSLSAGTLTPVAGAYSPFTLDLTRGDGSQTLSALDVTLPEGLLGKLAGVERCPQADIEAAERLDHEGEGHIEAEHPSCPEGSELGVANVGAGSGRPFYVTGHAYLAGPYKGAPCSIVVITPAIAGPFDLGAVVVRSALFINPTTAQVTVQSDPFPTILDGIPLDLRSIEVQVTRPDFTINPTSCEKLAVSGTVAGASSTVGVSSPFQVGGCNGLPFKPTVTVSTQGKTSRKAGASLTLKVTSPGVGQADVHRLKIQLPEQLPSRLETIKQACTEAQFDDNPAGCPEASNIGAATVVTPLLGQPLVGPAYFVSHGSAKFPEVIMVLQSEGVTIELSAETFISNKGITTSTANTVPDAPFTSFTLVLPEGPHSALAAPDGKLCQDKLVIPTALEGQNGVVIKQQTPLEVTGCAAAKPQLTRKQKLRRALAACRKEDKGNGKHGRRERQLCERNARKKYGPREHSKHANEGAKHKDKRAKR